MRAFLAVSLVVASLVLDGCGGCSDDGKGNRLPDAPVIPDMPPDMMVQSQPVTLTVTNLGQPAPDVTVYFVNADDMLVKATVTDASGTASAVMAAGGSVTALNPFAAQVAVAPAPGGKISTDELRTFVGVKPGDHLVLTHNATTFVTFQLNATAVEGANTYDVFTSCGTSSIIPGGGGGGSGSPDPGGQVALENCNGTADIAILASLNTVESHDKILGLYHANAAVMDDTTLDLTADTYQDLTSVAFTYMNAPDAAISVLHAPITAHGTIGPFLGDASGGTGTIQEPTLTGVTKAAVGTSLLLNSQHQVLDWGAFTTDYMLDLANLLLPEFTSDPSFDTATSKFSWTEDATGATPDLTFVALFDRRPDPLRRWHWELAAPHPAGEIKLPRLPTDIYDWKPADGDEISVDPVSNAKVPGGYDAVRARIFDLHDQGDLTGFVTGATGRVVIVQSQPR